MRRRVTNKDFVLYTLATNQGSPDVFVDGSYMGTVSNGQLQWKAKAYNSAKIVTLENITVPERSVVSYDKSHSWFENGKAFSYSQQSYEYRGYRKTVVLTFIAGIWELTTNYSGVTSATLPLNDTNLTINANGVTTENWYSIYPVQIRDVGERSTPGWWASSGNSYSISGASLTVNFGAGGGSWTFQGINTADPREYHGFLHVTNS